MESVSSNTCVCARIHTHKHESGRARAHVRRVGWGGARKERFREMSACSKNGQEQSTHTAVLLFAPCHPPPRCPIVPHSRTHQGTATNEILCRRRGIGFRSQSACGDICVACDDVTSCLHSFHVCISFAIVPPFYPRVLSPFHLQCAPLHSLCGHSVLFSRAVCLRGTATCGCYSDDPSSLSLSLTHSLSSRGSYSRSLHTKSSFRLLPISMSFLLFSISMRE